jgi:ribosomal protein L7Ae-like RNA K-turn-binding protein
MDRLFNAIGLCMKAGKAQSGAFAVEKTVKAGKAKLVLLEETASEATRAHYEQLCAFHGVPFMLTETVGRAIGKESRIVMAVTDDAFRTMIEHATCSTDGKRG